jgi:hypothetical protein
MVNGPNLYAYCNNNPTNLIDPWGLQAGMGAVGGAIAGATAAATKCPKGNQTPTNPDESWWETYPWGAFWNGFAQSWSDQSWAFTHFWDWQVYEMSALGQAESLGPGYYKAEWGLIGISGAAALGAGSIISGELAVAAVHSALRMPIVQKTIIAGIMELATQTPRVVNVAKQLAIDARPVIERLIK